MNMCFSPPQGSTKVRMPPLPFYGKCVIPFPFRPISTRMGRLMSTHAGSKRSDLRTSDDKSPRSAPFRHVAPRSTTPKVSSGARGRLEGSVTDHAWHAILIIGIGVVRAQ